MRLFFSLLVLPLLLAACRPGGADPTEMIAAAKALDRQWAEAFNKGDIDGLMALYWNSPDLVVYPSDAMELHGWDQVKESYRMMVGNMQHATISYGDLDYAAAGDVVISRGTWTISVPTLEGPVFDIRGRFTDVKAVRNGTWVIVMEHGSVPMPPPSHEMTM